MSNRTISMLQLAAGVLGSAAALVLLLADATPTAFWIGLAALAVLTLGVRRLMGHGLTSEGKQASFYWLYGVGWIVGGSVATAVGVATLLRQNGEDNSHGGFLLIAGVIFGGLGIASFRMARLRQRGENGDEQSPVSPRS